MGKRQKRSAVLAGLLAFSLIAQGVYLPLAGDSDNSAAAADTSDPRLVVDLNANDGRKASYARNAENWIVVGGSSASTTIDGVTFKLSNGGSVGGDIKSVNCKILQQMSGIYPYLTMDGVCIDEGDNGGVIKLEISGLSAGTHSLKTWHSCVDNASTGSLSVSVNGQTVATGVSCPTRVTDEDDAGMSYSTFTVTAGQTITVLIKSEGNGTVNNAWLNGFEIDGGDPFKGISDVYPADKDSHLDIEEGLSWTAGSNAKSHNVYIGTDFDTVFNATTSSSVFKGNQSGTSYALDDSYSSIPVYYWRVDEVDSSGNVVKGAVYSFQVNRLAFPTAEGYGRNARGGKGGQIIEVTNLNDSGEGSLRWALCDEQFLTDDWKGVPRIIVFRVGGVIELQSRLMIPDNGGSVYIAGQTAPGDGITLINYDFGAMGTSDAVIRDVRTRVGDMNGASCGGMGLSSCNECIIDHCSISWATDEGFSSRQAQNITFQWNIIGESLHDSVHYDGDRTGTETHAFAASIGGYTGSYHHNLLINCTGRNWSLAGAMEQDAIHYGGQCDISNNVVYNWKDRTTDGGVRRLNFVNNYYKAGAESDESLHIVSIDGNELGTIDMQMMYVSGNMMVGRDGTILLASTDNAWDEGRAKSGGKNSTNADVRSDTPFFESYVNIESAADAYKSVIAGAGATAPGWDYIDARYIKEVTNGTYTYTGSKQGLKGIIDSQDDVGGYPNSSNFSGATAPTDSDHDGMPDTWETEHGLNPDDASDGPIVSLSADDYTNVEMYLNELAGDPVEYNGTGTTSKVGATIDTTYEYTITNVGSGLQMEAAESDAASGTDVQQGETGVCGWTLESVGGGYYKIYSEVSDGKTYLLNLDEAGVENGTNVNLWGDDASDAQLFKFVANSDGTYTIVTKVSEDASCLGVASASTEDGASVVEWECTDSDDQKWVLDIKIDPLNGKLIQNLVIADLTTYQSWSIDEAIQTGDLVFGDRDATYSVLPDALVNAEAIITACDSKNATTDLASFTAGENILAYVALDSRVTTVPAWLSEWTLTDMTVTNSKDVVFNLYQKTVASGESVTLGTNGQSSGCVNYTVFAVADTAEQTDTLYGDVNVDEEVSVSDLILMARYIAEDLTVEITDAGLINADCKYDTFINSADITALAQYLVHSITLEELGPQAE